MPKYDKDRELERKEKHEKTRFSSDEEEDLGSGSRKTQQKGKIEKREQREEKGGHMHEERKKGPKRGY